MQEMEYSILMEDSLKVKDIGGLEAVFENTMEPMSSSGLKNITVESETLRPQDVADQLQNPRVKGIAISMPMTLIAPFDSDIATGDGFVGNTAWGINAIEADSSPFSGAGITVAVLDTGIDSSHSAFEGVALIQENFTDEAPEDLHGHGTHVAGTIFGRNVDGKRIGVATGINKALIGKTLGEGGGSSDRILKAITWANENGAHIISMSLGIDFPGFVDKLVNLYGYDIREATSLALEGYRANVNSFGTLARSLSAKASTNNGSIIVAASGNESKIPDFEIGVAPPAAAVDISAIGAAGRGDSGFEVAGFSNRRVNVVAPGVHIQSAKLGGGLIAFDGTSMATPHAAGVAALFAEKMKIETGTINTNAIRAKLEASGSVGSIATEFKNYKDVGNGFIMAPQY